jgi:Cu+-exporting ATPase
VVIDKTATLTEGKPKVTAVWTRGYFGEDELLRLAASLERASEHPLASAIVEAAKERTLELSERSGIEAPAGKGVLGTIEGHKLTIGNASFLESNGIATAEFTKQAGELRAEGATVIFVGIDGKADGLLVIADPIKPTTPDAVKTLQSEGMRIVMLTGDNKTTAEAVARRLGIDDVMADVLPEEKSAVVEQLRADGRIVAMAGDGVNDAPALAAADVGIAMGTGTDVAIESAGVTLLKGDLQGIVRARRLWHDAQHKAEPLLRVHLEWRGRADCRWRALSELRHSSVADHRGGRHGALLAQRDQQRTAVANCCDRLAHDPRK